MYVSVNGSVRLQEQVMHLGLNHLLEDSDANIFIDFSSAFNTIQPYVLIKKIKAM